MTQPTIEVSDLYRAIGQLTAERDAWQKRALECDARINELLDERGGLLSDLDSYRTTKQEGA